MEFFNAIQAFCSLRATDSGRLRRLLTWKSSTDGAERWMVVRRWCHWRSVFRVSELSALAACSSWKFRIRDMAPYALVR